MLKPFSQACENNAGPILSVLSRLLLDKQTVLEIGSGTGQHAVTFAKYLPHIQWQPSDLLDNHEGISLWLAEAALNNVLPPIDLDVSKPLEEIVCLDETINEQAYDVIFSANTLHIFSWQLVEKMFALTKQLIMPQGLLIIYGPFNYQGAFTSESNLRFDQWLKAADSQRGIRDFERVNTLAQKHGFELTDDIAMPANNRLLVWVFKG